MNREEHIQNQLKEHLRSISEETYLDQREFEQLIEECVSVDESWPIYNIQAGMFEGESRKPSNIKVEFDIESCFQLLAGSGLISEDPVEVFAAVSAISALVSRKSKIELEPETGFVYWVAYDNQQDPWVIPKGELVSLAVTESKSSEVPFELSEQEVEQRIRRLRRINSFRREVKQGEEYLILRERCSSDWS